MDGDELVDRRRSATCSRRGTTAKQAGLDGKADGPSGEVTINSPEAYGERCVAEMGEIPFFKKIGDGSYDDVQTASTRPRSR